MQQRRLQQFGRLRIPQFRPGAQQRRCRDGCRHFRHQDVLVTIGPVVPADPHREVESAAVELTRRVRDHQTDLVAVQFRAQLREARHQPLLGETRMDREHEPSTVALPPQRLQRGGDFPETGGGTGPETAPLLGQTQAVMIAHEQGPPQGCLEVVHVPSHSGLADPQFLGGAREAGQARGALEHQERVRVGNDATQTLHNLTLSSA